MNRSRVTSRPNPPRSAHRRGFSLLELTLALAMVAMLTLSLYMAMNLAIKAHRTASATVDPIRAASIAADMATKDFQSILRPTGVFSGAFLGTHESAGASATDAVEFFCIGAD